MECALVTVIETTAFARRAEKLLSPDERDEVVTFLAENPEAGDEIPGTGGVRKVRFAAKGKGKSGGVRVIYYPGFPRWPSHFVTKWRESDIEINVVWTAGVAEHGSGGG